MTPAESLREKLIYFIEPGITYKTEPSERRAEAARMVDEFVHELAEEQRAFVKREGVPTGDDPYTVGVRDVIDWIDPRFGAGPVRPDEEPTP